MLKKIASKMAKFAYEHSAYIRHCVEVYQKATDASMAPLEASEDASIGQISAWAIDEAAKIQARIHGFNLYIADYDKLLEQLPATKASLQIVYMEKAGILGYFSIIQHVVKTISEVQATQKVKATMGQCQWVEKHDPEDCVLIYPEQIQKMWTSLKKKDETIEEIVRQIVRHEYRHAEQVKALREVGGSDLVIAVFEHDAMFEYQNQITEKDAFGEQHLEHYRPIEEFVKEAVEAIG